VIPPGILAHGQLEALPPTPQPDRAPEGSYTVYKPGEVRVASQAGGKTEYRIWFTTPALDAAAIKRIESFQLFVQCHDQGFADFELGNWTWFELVILEYPDASTPKIKDGAELVWRSHDNHYKRKDYDWKAGQKFRRPHGLIEHLEENNAVGVRLCSVFEGWVLYAKDGCLVVEQAISESDIIDY